MPKHRTSFRRQRSSSRARRAARQDRRWGQLAAELRAEPNMDVRAAHVAICWVATKHSVSVAEVHRRARVNRSWTEHVARVMGAVLTVLLPGKTATLIAADLPTYPPRFIRLVISSFPEPDADVWAALHMELVGDD